MKQIDLIPGKHMCIATLCTHDATGARAAADSAPELHLFWDDGAAGSMNAMAVGLTITDRGAIIDAGHAGSYVAQLDVDDLLSTFDGPESYTVWGFWFWTMGGVDQAAPVEPFVLVPPRFSAHVATGTNTATSFKIAAMGDGAWGSPAAFAVTDGPVDMLVTITTGTLAGQCRRVTAYNATTGYLTVDAAFTGTPADTVRMMFSNF